MSKQGNPVEQALEDIGARAADSVRPKFLDAIKKIDEEEQAENHARGWPAAAETPLLLAREETHGNFPEVARIAQALKAAMRAGRNWERMSVTQKEALESRAVKIARIVCGDPYFEDHWRDDAGYAALGAPPSKI